jgi:cyanate lyase
MHLLSKADREWRDQRIAQKAEMGIEYSDIARQYGLSPDYIGCMLRRRRTSEGKENRKVGNTGPRGLWRYGSACGAD